MDDHLVKLSKRLSYVLRHHPEKIDLQLDKYGWVDVDQLIQHFNVHYGHSISREKIQQIITESPKQRFVIEGGNIRALYGHSIAVLPLGQPQTPPEFLYHGTSQTAAKIIRETGLQKMNREFVHLSADCQTAFEVGLRHDAHPVIFQVSALKAAQNGYDFFPTQSGIWLVAYLPSTYLTNL